MGSLSLLQRIFPTQESNWGLLHHRQILYQVSNREASALPVPNVFSLAALTHSILPVPDSPGAISFTWNILPTSFAHQTLKHPPKLRHQDFPAGSVMKTARDRGHTFNPWSRKMPGEGNGNPLQYSCLENSMDRGAWQATVHGVARVGHDLVITPPPL